VPKPDLQNPRDGARFGAHTFDAANPEQLSGHIIATANAIGKQHGTDLASPLHQEGDFVEL